MKILYLIAPLIIVSFLRSQAQEAPNKPAHKSTEVGELLYLPSDANSVLLMGKEDLAFFENKIYADCWGQFWMIKDSLVVCTNFSTEAGKAEILKLPKQIKHCGDLAWVTPDKIIVIDEDSLKMIEKGIISNLSALPYNNMSIAAASDSSLYVFGKTIDKNDSYQLFLYNLNRGWVKLCELKERINAVLGDGVMTFVAAGNKIYVLDYVLGSSVLYAGDDEVLSLAVTNEGDLVFSTSKAIIYSSKLERNYSFSNIGASKIWRFNDDLYLFLLNNCLIKITPVSSLKAYNDLIKH
jgi:hypothetical protein